LILIILLSVLGFFTLALIVGFLVRRHKLKKRQQIERKNLV
jgi:hypothetical protein